MIRKLDSWRFYSFGEEQYRECMGKVFLNNLNALRQANGLVAIFAACFAVFPIVIEKFLLGKDIGYINAVFYFITAFIALAYALILNYKMQTGEVSNKFIYVFTTLFYVNVMAFGVYLGVWSAPDKLATIIHGLLICALLMFINPPIFNTILTLSAIAVFITCSFLFKASFEIAIYDLFGIIIAGLMSLYFSWQITKLRMGMEISSTILEEERNKYMDQSIIDELTKLNNRRDFMATFKRYVNNYRTQDEFLCIAISDIDFFKNYNDHYGHPQGDECLRTIGTIFNKLKDTMGVYAARVGGEEFGMLWFEKDASHVDAVVSYLSSLIRAERMPHEKSKVSQFVTMSVGVYIEKLGATNDVNVLYESADNALYAAKGAGRNCAIISGRDRQQYKISPPDA